MAIAKEANRVRELSAKLESVTQTLKLEQANNEVCISQYVELEEEFVKQIPTNPSELKHLPATVNQDLKQDLDSIETELKESEENLTESIDDLTDL